MQIGDEDAKGRPESGRCEASEAYRGATRCPIVSLADLRACLASRYELGVGWRSTGALAVCWHDQYADNGGVTERAITEGRRQLERHGTNASVLERNLGCCAVAHPVGEERGGTGRRANAIGETDARW